MSEAKDPAIKLFGKTIQLPDTPAAAASECGGDVSAQSNDVSIDDSSVQERPCSPNSLPADSNLDISRAEEESEKIQDLSGGKADVNEKEDGTQSMMPEELTNSNSSSLTKENSRTPTVDTEAASADAAKAEDEQNETSNSQDKTLKKPDKILPCPRCNSMDTKFCYYNNYNVNQPRHFCKNCQRYWTAGGTMRNVPVGAGRRKNKSSALQYKNMAVSETLQNSRPDLPSGIQHPSLKPNGTVLTFGSGSPLCESMAAVLNIAEKTTHDHSRNGFHRPQELRIPVPYGAAGGNGDDQLNGSSVTKSSSKDEAGKNGLPDKLIPDCQSIPPQVPCFPGAPWPYAWNSVQWSSPIPATAFCPPGFPMPFYPAAPYWGCTVPGTWNVPWLNPPPASQNLNSPTSGPNSPTLGKHSRDDTPDNNTKEEPPKESNPEKCLWVPKTLRIDDPEEAAKSSIWATLGIKNDKVDSVGDVGLFKAFQGKGDEKTLVPETSTVLQANPAALSRSLSFHETT